MPGIFISYRRSDSGGHTGRLTADLIEGFEPQELFRDIEAIEAGVDFAQAIERAVNTCSVMLAVIGPQWVTTTTPDGKRRLDLEHDFVRVEIATALARKLRVIPVLVGNASMPSAEDLPEPLKALAGRQAHEITDRRWDYDVNLLFNALEKVPGVSRRKPKPAQNLTPTPARAAVVAPPATRGMSMGMKVLIGGVGVVVVLMGLGAFTGEAPEEPALALPPEPSTVTRPAAQPVAVGTPATPSPTTTARVEAEPQPVRNDTPAPAQPAVAPVNLTGTWQSDEGDQMYFEQTGYEVAVLAADGSGNHGFMGQGIVRGQHVELTLMHMQSGGSLVMQMTVAPDGRRMTGVARENVTGSSQNVTLLRE